MLLCAVLWHCTIIEIDEKIRSVVVENVRVCVQEFVTNSYCVCAVLCRCLIKTRNKIQSMSIILGMCEKRTVQIHGVITSSYCVANGLGTTTL